MKKNRLLFLLPLLASFVLTSCDMLSNLNFNGPRKKSSQEDSEVLDDSDDYSMPSSSSSKSSSKSSGRTSSSRSSSSSSAHQHEWADWIVVNEATCTTYGMKKRECTICGQIQTDSIPAYGHDFGEMMTSIEPTCTSSGVGQRECSRCHETISEIIPARGHDWGDWDIANYPTCTTSGSGRHTCRVCGAYEQQVIPEYGHSYNENDINWTSQPTCTQDGVGYVRCTRCNEQVTVYNPALGHSTTLVDYRSPQSGFADTRVYRCQRCGESSLSFSTDALSNESKKTLVEEWYGEGEIGYRFFGHPIGNAVSLDEAGNVSENSHEPIFNPSLKGDFLEIIFNLTAQQAAALGQCMLYCDVKPASYMNGMDFFASRTGDVEWTPGFHIQGAKYGQQIEGYRYILYVDNQPVEFDPGIKAPVVSNGNNYDLPRNEYAVPYVFNLHSGTNKFSLHMAGGYRSTFFNFSFRSLTNPHTHSFDAWDGDGDYHWRVCTSANCYAAEGAQYDKATHTWGEQYDVIPSTCTTQGSYKVRCTVCNYEKTVTIKEVAHSWVGGEVAVEGSQGRQNLTCSVCNTTKEVTGAFYSTFLYADAIQNNTTLDNGKFRKNTTYSFVVFNVPAAGTYTLSFTMKGSTSGNGERIMNGTTNPGQGFTIDANGVPGVFYGDGKTYAQFLGEDQSVWVEVVFGEITLLEGTNIINIISNNGDYRLSMKADANMTLAPKA